MFLPTRGHSFGWDRLLRSRRFSENLWNLNSSMVLCSFSIVGSNGNCLMRTITDHGRFGRAREDKTIGIEYGKHINIQQVNIFRDFRIDLILVDKLFYEENSDVEGGPFPCMISPVQPNCRLRMVRFPPNLEKSFDRVDSTFSLCPLRSNCARKTW